MKKYRSVLSPVLWMGMFVILLLNASVARAASQSDVFLGISHLGQNTYYSNAGGQWGWNGALHIHLRPFLGVEGDVAQYGWGAQSNVPHSTTVMFGPRFTVGGAGIHVFVHGLAGIEHVNNANTSPTTGTQMSVAAGGGLDLPIAPFFSWRIMADYVAGSGDAPYASSHNRVSTGVAFHF